MLISYSFLVIQNLKTRQENNIFGNGCSIVKREQLFGGDINQAFKLTLSDKTTVFMKSNSIENAAFFPEEEKGLKALKECAAIGVPEVISHGIDDESKTSFLLLEYLESAPKIKNYAEVLGHELAALHKSETKRFLEIDSNFQDPSKNISNSPQSQNKFGFSSDNFIGYTKQINTPASKWADFFRESRLMPQFKMAERYFDNSIKTKIEKLLSKIENLIPEPDFPSLIHGDLWSGNVITGPDGKGWLIDPACYVGSFEAELAMTSLFGGFSSAFYNAYDEIIKIPSDFSERIDLYNLYHLLNHLNIFGRSYLSEVIHIINEYA